MPVAINGEDSDEVLLDNIVRVCQLLTRRIVLLIDLIEGDASVGFTRPLLYFLYSSPQGFRSEAHSAFPGVYYTILATSNGKLLISMDYTFAGYTRVNSAI